MAQTDFSAYVESTRSWLKKNRVFLTENTTQELIANTPFEVKPKNNESIQRGILLVHGLGDSPFSFSDVANALSEQGFHVRTVLLSGHGSKPSDLLNTKSEEWNLLLEQQVELFKREVDHLYLGGFSTGANLVTTLANKDKSIKGLILYSPAFKHRSLLSFLSPLLTKINAWTIHPKRQFRNYAKYSVLPNNAAEQFYKSSLQVLQSLESSSFDRPVLIAISEKDNVIDTTHVLNLFQNRFTNKSSRLLWFGNKNSHIDDERVAIYQAKFPNQRISNFSHMSMLYEPDNYYYGRDGEHRICDEGPNTKSGYLCATSEKVWYSAFGYHEEGKIYARLTYNPSFNIITDQIKSVFASAKQL